ncbi:MAG: hypothetical protein ACUVQY_10900 [Thermoproteota archaeon]
MGRDGGVKDGSEKRRIILVSLLVVAVLVYEFYPSIIAIIFQGVSSIISLREPEAKVSSEEVRKSLTSASFLRTGGLSLLKKMF